jgi:hypothetical protein
MNMNCAGLPELIEELIDLKIQQYAETQMKPNSEVARVLREKQHTDRRRLEQIRFELGRLLQT